MGFVRPVLASLLVLVAACTHPASEVPPPSFQPAATHMRDWNTIARRIAGEMERYALLPNRQTGAPADPQYRAFHIHVTSLGSTFLQFVKDSLETEILYRGGQVARLPVGATVINLEIDVVRWSTDRSPQTGSATIAGILNGGALLAADAVDSINLAQGAALVAGAGVGLDVLAAARRTYGAEAIWQASIVTRDRLILRARGPMYVRPADIALYRGDATLAPLPSPGPDQRPGVRTLRFTR